MCLISSPLAAFGLLQLAKKAALCRRIGVGWVNPASSLLGELGLQLKSFSHEGGSTPTLLGRFGGVEGLASSGEAEGAALLCRWYGASGASPVCL